MLIIEHSQLFCGLFEFGCGCCNKYLMGGYVLVFNIYYEEVEDEVKGKKPKKRQQNPKKIAK